VANRAIEVHSAESPWREIVAHSAGGKSPAFGVAIFEDEPERPVDRYALRLHDGRLEVAPGASDTPIDWRVSVDFLRHVASHPDSYVADPRKLELGWLPERLGLRS